jgi:hypothetical protein
LSDVVWLSRHCELALIGWKDVVWLLASMGEGEKGAWPLPASGSESTGTAGQLASSSLESISAWMMVWHSERVIVMANGMSPFRHFSARASIPGDRSTAENPLSSMSSQTVAKLVLTLVKKQTLSQP